MKIYFSIIIIGTKIKLVKINNSKNYMKKYFECSFALKSLSIGITCYQENILLNYSLALPQLYNTKNYLST